MPAPTFETDLRSVAALLLDDDPTYKQQADVLGAAAKHIEKLERALHSLVQYAEWQMQEGTGGHHPTLPSATARATAVLKGEY